MMYFAQPWLLLVPLALLAPLLVHYLQKQNGVAFPSLTLLGKLSRSRWAPLRHLDFALRALALLLLGFALARPQDAAAPGKKSSEGLDIVLIVDTSRSMEARDFVLAGERPNRLGVVKKVIADFVRDRPSDRIGIVVFGTEAFTQAPLTLDHDVLLRFLDRIQIGMAGDDTAIGDGLATAVNRLKDVDARSKIAILLTDGGNTAGRVDPLAAAKAAAAKDVKVYTIGVGGKGEVPVVIDGQVQSRRLDVDTQLLADIAKTTNATTYMASDTETLVKVYDTIDRLEKTRIDVQSFDDRDERYAGFVAVALALLLGEALVGLTRFRRIP